MITVAIHPDRIGNESYSETWAECLGSLGVRVRWVNLLGRNALDQVRGCDGVMWRWAHHPQDKQSAQSVLYTIEHCVGIPVYPNSRTAWHYDEKTAQLYLLRALGAPMPETWLFWEEEEALAWAYAARYPVVFKLSSGAGSSNVLRVDGKKQATALIRRMFHCGMFPYTMNEYARTARFPRGAGDVRKLVRRALDGFTYTLRGEYPRLPRVWWRPEYGYAYFQEYVAGNETDTRITVIGDRAFGYVRANRPDDFRASGSGRTDHDPSVVDPRCIEIAFQVSDRGGFQSMAYDFLQKDGEPVICEISYTYVDRMVYDCPGHWQRGLAWVEGQMWPEEAQVEDFVRLIREQNAGKG